MANYKVTTEQGTGKIATLAKQEVLNIIIKALTAEYGEEWVRMARVGTSSSMKNVLAVRVGELIDEDGFPHDLCTTVEVTTKSHKAKTIKGKTTDPFDFVEATEEYEDYLTEKATKQAEAKARKAKGSKTKQEKEAETAKKAAELSAVSARVEAKKRVEAEAKRYRVEVNGETVAENLTMEEAKAKRDELADSGEVKIFEQR